MCSGDRRLTYLGGLNAPNRMLPGVYPSEPNTQLWPNQAPIRPVTVQYSYSLVILKHPHYTYCTKPTVYETRLKKQRKRVSLLRSNSPASSQ